MAFPSATNSLNSLGIYEQRFLYNKEYPSDVPLPVDLWYEKHFYGRSNLKNESIFLSVVTAFVKDLALAKFTK